MACIQIDQPILTANITKMQAIADNAGVALRPHAKTHKSVAVARQQMDAGAVGLTVSKPAEALPFMRAGIPSIKICYPVIDPDAMHPVLTLAQQHQTEIIGTIDSPEGVTALVQAAQDFDLTLPVFLEVNVGLDRCGVAADSPALLDLAAAITATPHLHLLGLTAHAGHAYGVDNRDAAARIAEQERSTMMAAKQRLADQGIAITAISVGSTPSIWAQQDFTGITEIKPGNYVFNDLTQLNIGVIDWAQIALTISATIISVNDRYMIINAGSKTLTSDLGPHGNQSITGHGLAFTADETPGQDPGRAVTKLSEEHGWIAHDGGTLPVGTALTIYPNHSCPVVNLTDHLTIHDDSGQVDIWPVDARGTR
ncbi:MAG: alanine racemase [Pseudomonadota bacterium]